MKKLFMTLVAAVIAVSASAQVYIGGNAGIASTKIGDQDSKTTYKVLPEIGYKTQVSDLEFKPFEHTL